MIISLKNAYIYSILDRMSVKIEDTKNGIKKLYTYLAKGN